MVGLKLGEKVRAASRCPRSSRGRGPQQSPGARLRPGLLAAGTHAGDTGPEGGRSGGAAASSESQWPAPSQLHSRSRGWAGPGSVAPSWRSYVSSLVARHGFSGLGGVSVPLSIASYCLFSVSECAGELTTGREAGGQQPGSAPTAFHPVQPLCAPSSRLVRGAQVLSTARPRQPLCSTV